MRIFSYHVYSTRDGGSWLSDDEKHWTSSFDEAASFRDNALAVDIGNREKGPDDTIHVFGLMGGGNGS